jgi:hypothetical protein
MTGLPTLPVHALHEQPTHATWLVQQIWGAAAVGVIGGPPKACKSWLGLDLAVSVASGTACLEHFAVDTPGPVVAYLAEDALHSVRDRVAQICTHRGLALADLDLHVITTSSLRLDLEADRHALHQTLLTLKPRMLLLDPLVRLHSLDENSAADISRLLGFLRDLNRRLDLAIVLVHHMAKRARKDPGQALRGSSDLYAWVDSACYLARRDDQYIRLTIQHRAAHAPEPMLLRLAGGNAQPCCLQLHGQETPPAPLEEAVRNALRHAASPCSRASLRRQLRVNNARLGEALTALEQRRLVLRTSQGWHLTHQPDPQQLILST